MALTINEAVVACRVPRRTLYHWVEIGLLQPVMLNPIMVARGDVESVRDRWRPGHAYGVVMGLRNCTYAAARMWVRRQRERGLTLTQMYEKLRAL